MVFGIPLLENRVAPRCSAAEELLLVTTQRGRILGHRRLGIEGLGPGDLQETLFGYGVDTLVCGGISIEMRSAVEDHSVVIVDNVVGSAEEIMAALEQGQLHAGFGLAAGTASRRTPRFHSPATLAQRGPINSIEIDCLSCRDRICLQQRDCRSEALRTATNAPSAPAEIRQILDASMDITLERERQLCRLAEVVYFSLEMGYESIGLAFCLELLEPTAVVADVLKRFFRVVPVCCKIGGRSLPELLGSPIGADSAQLTSCNPVAQATALNRAATDFNLVVGLCIGADAIFSRLSEAPVSTLFVKDRSLANNPIGAVYSDYYLRESVSAAGSGRSSLNHAMRAKEELS